jgi:mannose-6-phosphate isomerase-like protein (cupin superfamily)
MMTGVLGRRLPLLATSLIALAASGSAQSAAPPRSATDVTRADLAKVLAQAPADQVSDQQIRVVDIGQYNVAVGVLHRSAKARQTAISHAQVTEVYHILDGSGTFVTGGTMDGAAAADPQGNTVKILVGPSATGASIRDGQSRRVGPGDVIVIPPGVAHWFSAMDSDMNYLVVRVDADHVLPSGYVHPSLAPRP